MSSKEVLVVSEDEFFIFEVYSAQSRAGIFRILKKYPVQYLVFFRDFFLSHQLLEHLRGYSSQLEVLIKSDSNGHWLERIFPSNSQRGKETRGKRI